MGLLLLAALALPSPAVAAETVRVALAVKVPHARVSGRGEWSVKTPDGARILFRRAGTLRLHAEAGTVRVEGLDAGPAVLLVPASGLFDHDGRTWRGYLQARNDGGGLTLVDFVPLEDYVAGVLGGELAPHWPLETQKALAVAARTYALYQVARAVEDDGSPRSPFYDVVTTVKDQVYPGLAGESRASRAAVASTRGEVLRLGPRLLKAYYHSACGGHTSDSLPVFGPRVPELVGVGDPFCRGGRSWSREFTVETLRRLVAPVPGPAPRKAQPPLGPVAELGPEGYDASGRIATFRLVDRSGREARVTGHRLRMLLGPSAMRSTRARMAVLARDAAGLPTRVRLSGTGWGHGVGLCQWGAEAMGRQGYGYREILRHYYPQASLARGPS